MITAAPVNKTYQSLLAFLQGEAGFVFVKSLGRYRDVASGKFVSESSLRSISDRVMTEYTERRLESLTLKLIDGKLDLQDWQSQFAKVLKDSHIVASTIGRGGRAQMGFSEFGRVGARLREEYRYLNQFAQDIKSGRLTSAQILARAKMYAQGVRTSYWEGRREAFRGAGYLEERRRLHPAEHCTSCVQYANLGWKPIGTLPPPGTQSECMHECKCDMEFRKEID